MASDRKGDSSQSSAIPGVKYKMMPEDFLVGWICVSFTDFVAAGVFLNTKYEEPEFLTDADSNAYQLGRIGSHNIVVAVSPKGDYGTSSGAGVASNMLQTFPYIRICLSVGIGGGAPSLKNDIRLGDVVVGVPRNGHGGVLQYSFGKTMTYRVTGYKDRLPDFVCTAVAELEVAHEADGHHFESTINSIIADNPRLDFGRPPQNSDRLYRTGAIHTESSESSDLVQRSPRTGGAEVPVIHHGLIASANRLMNDAFLRDKFAEEKNVLCFEMGGSGLPEDIPCLVIRGICDYADTHKKKEWQGYAAITAAAYANDLLCRIPTDTLTAFKSFRSLALTQKQEQRNDRKECLRWLFITYPPMDKQDILKLTGGLSRDSYRWILNHANFKQFWDDPDSHILWIKGNPGKGKTLLLCGVIEELKKEAKHTLSFFFCQERKYHRNTAVSVLRGLIFLLVWRRPSLIDHVRQQYDIDEKLSDSAHSFILLTKMLRSILADPALSGHTVLVIDALDECTTSQRELLDLIIQSASDSSSQIKWIVSSRNSPQIENKLGHAQTVRLDLEVNQKFVNQAIRAYITHSVAQLVRTKRYTATFANAADKWFTTYLETKAPGHFLWVALACEELSKVSTEDDALSKLETLSPELDHLNDRIAALTGGQIHNYPPSTATTRSSRSSQDVAHASTAPTSTGMGGRMKMPDSTDTESVYTSDVSEAPVYVQQIATRLFEEFEPTDSETLERMKNILPLLLQGFAQKIGGEKQNLDHFKIMKFFHKKRQEIAKRFEEEYYRRVQDSKETPQQRDLSGMSPDEKFTRWSVEQEMDDPNPAGPQTVHYDDDAVDKDGKEDDENEDDEDDFRLSTLRNLVTSSTAFQWLLERGHRETNLTSFEAGSMQDIAQKIRRILHSREKNHMISSRRGPPTYSMVFQSHWDPLAFVHEQEYDEEAGDVVEGALVIVQGANGDAEAMPCSEYMSRTWPLLGEDFIRLVKHVVQSTPGLRCSVALFDKTKLTAWIASSGRFFLKAEGVAETIVEVGEVYGWIISALRSAPGDAIASVTPSLGKDADNHDATFRVTFRLQFSSGPAHTAGQCWQDLFRNPVVVLGFPVRRRQPGQEPGLEFPLSTLATLVGTQRIDVFCGRIFLKGFCTMLVPTKYTEDTVHWHVLFNEDGSRIPFTDSRVSDVIGDFDLSKHLKLSDIENARHVVGWCEDVRNYAGSKGANYAIQKSRLPPPGSGFVLERVTLSGGQFVNAGFSVAIGKQNRPVRAERKTKYYKQLEWIERRFVVLFDQKDRRAWLIDGASALLHLAKASLAYRRTQDYGNLCSSCEDKIIESNTPYMGKISARHVLWNKDNADLKISEEWNRTVEETTQKVGEAPETTQKTQKTWEQFAHVVEEIYNTMSAIFDIQTDTSPDGYQFRIRRSPRRRLEEDLDS